MSIPKYSDSKEDIIKAMSGTSGSGSQTYDIGRAILEVKHQEDITKETKSLKMATWCLFSATVGLVVATIVLVIITYSAN